MLLRKLTRILVLIVISMFLYSCPEVTLPGDITGIVTDAETSELIQAATVKINKTDDSTLTGNDGTYLLKNIAPGEYEIQVTKFSYYNQKEDVEVLSAETQSINFNLNKIPLPKISVAYLEFCLNAISLSFTISNSSIEKLLTYAFQTSQSWIYVSPPAGVIGNETGTFNVTIDRTGLSTDTIKESITLISILGTEKIPDIIINVYLNGCYDTRTNINHKVVKIGSQIWMQENLNVTRYTDGTNIPVVEDKNNWLALTASDKACCWYNNYVDYKKAYGVLYTWAAAMNGATSSSAIPSGVQGVCPTGWHLPSLAEWINFSDYLNNSGYNCKGNEYAIAKSLAATSGWDICLNQVCAVGNDQSSNNSSGFTARPAGYRSYEDGSFIFKGIGAYWLTSTEFNTDCAYCVGIDVCSSFLYKNDEFSFKRSGYSVRCVKDP